jgi:pimeloyl-ACP methyl ester carboxylesterase
VSSQLDVGGAAAISFAATAGPIAALQSGRRDGVPVLLVPGYTGSKEDFAPLLDPLAAAGFQATAVDLPGQFESPGPAGPESYTPDRLGAEIRAVAHRLGSQVHLLGHSFGGLVARAAAIAEPSVFGSLVLMDSGPAALDGQRRDLIEHLAPALPLLGVEGVYAASEAASQSAPNHHTPSPELAAFLRQRFLTGSEWMLRGMADALLAEPDRVDELAAIALPTLVVYGADDDAWPPALQRQMARRLGARTVVIADAAHSPAVENTPDTLAALIEFWRTHPLAVAP